MIIPAVQVCWECSPLLLDEKTVVVSDNRACTDLARLVLLDHELLGKGAGDRDSRVRPGNRGFRGVARRGASPGSRASLRRARGGASVVGRRGRARVRIRHAALLSRRASRPAAYARRERARHSGTG